MKSEYNGIYLDDYYVKLFNITIMLYISKERKAQIAKVLAELKEGKQRYFIMEFTGRDVLYANDAYQIIAAFVNLHSAHKLSNFVYSPKIKMLKLVCRGMFAEDEDYYWLYKDVYSGLCYLMEISKYKKCPGIHLRLKVMSVRSFKEDNYRTVRASNIKLINCTSDKDPFFCVFRYTGEDLEPVKLCKPRDGKAETILRFKPQDRPTTFDLFDEYKYCVCKNSEGVQWMTSR